MIKPDLKMSTLSKETDHGSLYKSTFKRIKQIER